MNLIFLEGQQYAEESPLEIAAGNTVTFTCNYWATVTASGASATVYQKTGDGSMVDVTSTVMPSGSVSYTSKQVVLKALTALSAGYMYRVDVTAVISGDTFVKSLIIRCPATSI